MEEVKVVPVVVDMAVLLAVVVDTVALPEVVVDTVVLPGVAADMGVLLLVEMDMAEVHPVGMKQFLSVEDMVENPLVEIMVVHLLEVAMEEKKVDTEEHLLVVTKQVV